MIFYQRNVMSRKSKQSKKIFLRDTKKKRISPQLYSLREKLQNYIWIFHIGDVDDKPSVPHAHAKDVGYRLDAWTGDIYPAGNERNKPIGKLKRKELSKLHSDTGFLNFAKKQIEWYSSEFPHINFYVPEWFGLKSKQLQLVTMNKDSEVDIFVFIGRGIIN